MKKFIIILIVIVGLFAQEGNCQIERQQGQAWCWAAAVQSVLYQTGAYYTQPEIVTALYGIPVDRPATTSQLLNLCHAFGLPAVWAGRPGSPQELYQTLSAGRKIIACVNPSGGSIGHCIVIQGFDSWGNVIISDPADGSTRVNTLQQLYLGWRWTDAVIVG